MTIKKGADAVRTIKPSEKTLLNEKAATTAQMPIASPANDMKRDQDQRSNARDLSEFPDLADVLPDLMSEYLELQATIKVAEVRKKELSEMVGPLLVAAGHESIRGDGWTVTRSATTRKTIKPELLLANGVAMTVIEESTVVTASYAVTVRAVKGKE